MGKIVRILRVFVAVSSCACNVAVKVATNFLELRTKCVLQMNAKQFVSISILCARNCRLFIATLVLS